MTMPDQPLTLLCLSHLHWDHVWQRPQHLMSRLAERCRVIFVDPPEITTSVTEPQMAERESDNAVEVLRPLFPESHLAAGTRYEDLWLGLLPGLLERAGPNTILWVLSPAADYLVEAALPHVLLPVYDCMDDLASFRGGTQEMRVQEEHLLHLVELVFTGGRSMYEARKNRHPRVHCFPSGVDVAHYRQVRDADLHEHAALADVAHPRLGYFGVLDERIDWPMIADVATRRPAWQWVLVGPTAKVDPNELPKAANIHYVGQQQYAALPSFLKGFDIATMPFELNEATRFISPTKTLEYLAGDKQVISSSVPDVVATYPGIVELADGADAWIAGVETLLAEDDAARQARLEQAQPLLEAGTWDGIAARIWSLIEERLQSAGDFGGQGVIAASNQRS